MNMPGAMLGALRLHRFSNAYVRNGTNERTYGTIQLLSGEHLSRALRAQGGREMNTR